MNPFFEGFLLQASLILALGAQNIFVLESGILRRRQFLVATICSACDALLIGIGVLGAASLFVKIPSLKIGFGVLGVGFLVTYGFQKLTERVHTREQNSQNVESDSSAKIIILLSLGFSLLNPHVYLDTVVLIGGYSARYVELNERMQFGLGAAGFSLVWFFGLTLFASWLSSFLNRPRPLMILSRLSGIILLGLSLKLGSDVYGWMNGN